MKCYTFLDQRTICLITVHHKIFRARTRYRYILLFEDRVHKSLSKEVDYMVKWIIGSIVVNQLIFMTIAEIFDNKETYGKL